MSTTAVAAAAAGAVGVAAYLNAKFSIGMDLEQLRKDRSFTRRLNILIQKLGDRMTLYHMLELADQTNDALWFEGRTWTYAQAKAGESLTVTIRFTTSSDVQSRGRQGGMHSEFGGCPDR